MTIHTSNILYLVWGTEMSQNPIEITWVRELVANSWLQVKNYLWDTRTASFITNQEEGIHNISPDSSMIIVPRDTIPRELEKFIPKDKDPNTGTLALVYVFHQRCSRILVVDFPGSLLYRDQWITKEYDLPNVMLVAYRATGEEYIAWFRRFLASR